MLHPNANIVACIRIPKSGSTSLSKMVQSLNGVRRYYFGTTWKPDQSGSHFQYYRHLRSKLKQNINKYKRITSKSVEAYIRDAITDGDILVGGHFDFTHIKQNVSARAKLITLVRNPIDRCISEYYYSRNGYLKKPIHLRWDSGALYKAAGTRDFESYLSFIYENKHYFGNVASKMLGINDIDNFESFSSENVLCWATLDDITAFEKHMSDIYQQKISVGTYNQTKERENISLSQSAKTLIEKINDLDMALYEKLRG